MRSRIKFYCVDFHTYIEENSYIDHLDDYLNSVTTVLNINDFQAIRNDLDISIKINRPQEYTNIFQYNYCSIENIEATLVVDRFYYYVKKVSQLANDTLQVDLHMDTVNSLIDPRQFTVETEITREHKDRFIKPSSWSRSTGGTLARKIDRVSEGIVPEKLKAQDYALTEGDNYNWYLIYRNQNTPTTEDVDNPVKVRICADHNITVGYQSTGPSKTYTVNDLADGQYYYFLDLDNPGGTYTVLGTSTYSETYHTYNHTNVLGSAIPKCIDLNPGAYIPSRVDYRTLQYLCLHRVGDELQYTVMYNAVFLAEPGYEGCSLYGSANEISTRSGGLVSQDVKWDTCSSIEFTQANLFRVSSNNYLDNVNMQSEGIKTLVTTTEGIYVGTGTQQIVNKVDDIIRTDSKYIKIIKCPYCPVEYTKTNGVYNFGDDWSYVDGYMEYNKNGLPDLGRTKIGEFPMNLLKRHVFPSDIAIQHSKVSDFESKLYHSDFDLHKIVYDSFAKEVKPELIVPNKNTTDVTVNVSFKPTNTISSNFGFGVNVPSATGTVDQDEDFGNVLLVSRNNEETLLNSEYINYIKYGRELDQKSNDLQLKNAQRNAGASTATTALSVLGSIVAALVPGGKGLSVGLLTGALGSGINTANQWTNVSALQESQANALQSKLTQLANQSASVAGSNDVDLMSWYSGNRVRRMEYRASEVEQEKLKKLFDYTGYKCHRYGELDADSRLWYNYVECTPDIPRELVGKLKAEWVNDLVERYKQGVTVYHRNQLPGGIYQWDLDRENENYEQWMYNGV